MNEQELLNKIPMYTRVVVNKTHPDNDLRGKKGFINNVQGEYYVISGIEPRLDLNFLAKPEELTTELEVIQNRFPVGSKVVVVNNTPEGYPAHYIRKYVVGAEGDVIGVKDIDHDPLVEVRFPAIQDCTGFITLFPNWIETKDSFLKRYSVGSKAKLKKIDADDMPDHFVHRYSEGTIVTILGIHSGNWIEVKLPALPNIPEKIYVKPGWISIIPEEPMSFRINDRVLVLDGDWKDEKCVVNRNTEDGIEVHRVGGAFHELKILPVSCLQGISLQEEFPMGSPIVIGQNIPDSDLRDKEFEVHNYNGNCLIINKNNKLVHHCYIHKKLDVVRRKFPVGVEVVFKEISENGTFSGKTGKVKNICELNSKVQVDVDVENLKVSTLPEYIEIKKEEIFKICDRVLVLDGDLAGRKCFVNSVAHEVQIFDLETRTPRRVAPSSLRKLNLEKEFPENTKVVVWKHAPVESMRDKEYKISSLENSILRIDSGECIHHIYVRKKLDLVQEQFPVGTDVALTESAPIKKGRDDKGKVLDVHENSTDGSIVVKVDFSGEALWLSLEHIELYSRKERFPVGTVIVFPHDHMVPSWRNCEFVVKKRTNSCVFFDVDGKEASACFLHLMRRKYDIVCEKFPIGSKVALEQPFHEWEKGTEGIVLNVLDEFSNLQGTKDVRVEVLLPQRTCFNNKFYLNPSLLTPKQEGNGLEKEYPVGSEVIFNENAPVLLPREKMTIDKVYDTNFSIVLNGQYLGLVDPKWVTKYADWVQKTFPIGSSVILNSVPEKEKACHIVHFYNPGTCGTVLNIDSAGIVVRFPKLPECPGAMRVKPEWITPSQAKMDKVSFYKGTRVVISTELFIGKEGTVVECFDHAARINVDNGCARFFAPEVLRTKLEVLLGQFPIGSKVVLKKPVSNEDFSFHTIHHHEDGMECIVKHIEITEKPDVDGHYERIHVIYSSNKIWVRSRWLELKKIDKEESAIEYFKEKFPVGKKIVIGNVPSYDPRKNYERCEAVVERYTLGQKHPLWIEVRLEEGHITSLLPEWMMTQEEWKDKQLEKLKNDLPIGTVVEFAEAIGTNKVGDKCVVVCHVSEERIIVETSGSTVELHYAFVNKPKQKKYFSLWNLIWGE